MTKNNRNDFSVPYIGGAWEKGKLLDTEHSFTKFGYIHLLAIMTSK